MTYTLHGPAAFMYQKKVATEASLKKKRITELAGQRHWSKKEQSLSLVQQRSSSECLSRLSEEEISL